MGNRILKLTKLFEIFSECDPATRRLQRLCRHPATALRGGVCFVYAPAFASRLHPSNARNPFVSVVSAELYAPFMHRICINPRPPVAGCGHRHELQAVARSAITLQFLDIRIARVYAGFRELHGDRVARFAIFPDAIWTIVAG